MRGYDDLGRCEGSLTAGLLAWLKISCGGRGGRESVELFDKERKHAGRLAWCMDRDLVTTAGGSLLIRRSPANRVASNSFARRLLSAAKASRGERMGGISPSKCWIRGEGWPVRVVLVELGARELVAERSIYAGRSITKHLRPYCVGCFSVGQE